MNEDLIVAMEVHTQSVQQFYEIMNENGVLDLYQIADWSLAAIKNAGNRTL